MLTADQIQQILPHRYPFLLVDRITELEEGKRAKGFKNVTINEEFFQGHFPGYPVMPGVLIIEAMAQVGGVALLSSEDFKGRIVFLTGIDNARFKRQVIPGDVLTMEVEFLKLRGSMGKGHGKVTVGDELVCEADILFAIGPKSEA
ncbi:3-hydroxyacyl-[acyl-carrier-protein] dehydratase FabZ [Kurthia zopfii]|uniref:3-hydroxyacyl-[acyl-carrier-protein] dehydratase FabZ n=1 Tax=Kurthia zopfii TaxID=1650 RepID=A0A2U3A9S5_9BACL|nr:3-hydroxyacyl-ACP dehydratase FabZ [Kurthia zopfii]PWI21303.1 3-hydroxyacyl-[acyl-carrier-protein] dehydratase FabZ [Kurthia zopfii]TDR34072.1 3-hydroxyacyl-[acyl-carrier-protein] dehydratase [Kurthia zopfii]STX08708.1 (3R)-hydroxymyristoyl-[acyl-carrier-protein] dehydratase [Kurthia zopfii]VEI05075.1 (3R)-hydroxymyristoyl-[acyl-carrier-protein] dehydratase [Kurthia zopfii]GEK31967.1 3-hydroxyacyl-[acyl-carrier-protein] dehydratase FabZ [Kurthia zopfii]